MKPKKIVVGMEFYQSFKEMKATVTAIDGDQVTVQYEDGTISNFMDGIIGLKKFLQNSIDRQLQGYEMNIYTPTSWTNDLAESNNIELIIDSMKDHKFTVDDEWTDSRYEWAKNLPNQTKGTIGLVGFCRKMESNGLVVEKNEKGEYDTGSERVAKIDDKRYIVRTAFKSSTDNSVTFNSIRKNVEWDKLICMVIFPNHIEMYEVDRDLVYLHLEENKHEIGWLTKDDWNVVHWHMPYPMPNIFERKE